MFVCMSSKKYPLRGCYFEWEKLPLSERGAFPKPFSSRNRTLGVFRSLRRATRALPSTCELLEKFDQNFNAGARRMRLRRLGACFYFVCGRSVGSSCAAEAATRRVLRMWGEPRRRPPEENGSGHCPPGGKCQRGLPARRKIPAGALRPRGKFMLLRPLQFSGEYAILIGQVYNREK